MPPELKIKLLKAFYVSSDYIMLLYLRYSAAIRFQQEALAIFKEKGTASALQLRTTSFWEQEVLPCWERTADELMGCWKQLERKQYRPMALFTADIFRHFNHLGYLAPEMFAWWSDEESLEGFREYEALIQQAGNNVYKTLSSTWEPEEILDESVTGNVPDDEDLLRYLAVGDSAKYNFYMQGTHPDDE